MELGGVFFLNSILLGIGLSMDAFSVSLANGLNNPAIKKSKACLVSCVFAFFQAAMPMIGWVCVHTFVSLFKSFEKFIPFIALILLSYIGIKMLIEGIKKDDDSDKNTLLTFSALLLQGVATSIDALSVGFTIADYGAVEALLCALIIAAVTFPICLAGVFIGKKFGNSISGKASILGGVILIAIGLEIFISGVF